MKVLNVNLKIILDSRGKETLEAELTNDKFSVKASVPSGKSKGIHEAIVLEPKKAIEKFEEIKPQVLAASASGRIEIQEEFDNFLISLDGTPNKQNFGANLILALSLAFARLKAKSENKELFEYIGQIANCKAQSAEIPKPIFNMIEGGAHAKNKLDFQEFQVIPEVKDFGIALDLGQEFYRKLKDFLEKKFGKENVVLGDESGFSCPFKKNEEAIEVLAELITKCNYPLKIGLDAAATQFFKRQETSDKRQGVYLIDSKDYSAEELKIFYLKLIEAYKILSIEDPFYEEGFDNFAELTKSNPEILIIADDLTTTNPERLKTAIDKKAGNAIIIKPDQIGTLTETLKVVQLAYQNKWQTIVSHRSRETMDDFIADLAVGVNAWGLKAGAPVAPERLAKYERILKILDIRY